MNEVLIHAMANRIKAGLMTLEQVPVPYKEAVAKRLSEMEGD